MLKENENIQLSGEEAIEILKQIEFILISLRNIARYYYDGKNSNEINRTQYEKQTTKFIDNNHITYKLADIRAKIANKFNTQLGDDDMDDIERELLRLTFWTKLED